MRPARLGRSALLGFLALLVGISGCPSTDSSGKSDGDGHDHGRVEEPARGPHGGRLLEDGGFAVEVTIFERGVPPEYRVYAYEDGKPLDPSALELAIELERFGGKQDLFRFRKREDYLAGDGVVEEPHSFLVRVNAAHGGATHRWEYESYEGRTVISPSAMAAAGIVVETAGPAAIATKLRVHGRIAPNEDALAHVMPRYAGVVRETRKRLGERVGEGEVLAVVESNQTLQRYEIRAPIAGTLTAKDVVTGEMKAEDSILFTIADLSTVWADFDVYPTDAPRLRAGQPVAVSTPDGAAEGTATIGYVAPVGDGETQRVLARAVLDNRDGAWRPGLFVTGEVAIDVAEVPVAVSADAIQTFRDWDVVFLEDGGVFQAMPVELGRSDGGRVAIVSGIEAGARYAAKASFVVKADIEKSGASHDH